MGAQSKHFLKKTKNLSSIKNSEGEILWLDHIKNKSRQGAYRMPSRILLLTCLTAASRSWGCMYGTWMYYAVKLFDSDSTSKSVCRPGILNNKEFFFLNGILKYLILDRSRQMILINRDVTISSSRYWVAVFLAHYSACPFWNLSF